MALIGKATFGRNQFQGKAAAVQQGLCPIYAPRKNISVRGYSEIGLEFARKVVAAQSGETRQIFSVMFSERFWSMNSVIIRRRRGLSEPSLGGLNSTLA